MAKKPELALPFAPLGDLVKWWRVEQVSGVVIGGLAVALLGRPRVTRDVDGLVLLAEDRWTDFLTTGRKFGFVLRATDALDFAREARVLLLRHQRSLIDVDIALGHVPFEKEMVARATIKKIAGVAVPLPTPEDLIIMKAVAHREKDLQDIDGLLAVHPDLDTRRVKRWVRAFADNLDMPELSIDLLERLSRLKSKKPGKRIV